jgi:hypothetical protein
MATPASTNPPNFSNEMYDPHTHEQSPVSGSFSQAALQHTTTILAPHHQVNAYPSFQKHKLCFRSLFCQWQLHIIEQVPAADPSSTSVRLLPCRTAFYNKCLLHLRRIVQDLFHDVRISLRGWGSCRPRSATEPSASDVGGGNVEYELACQ